MYERCIAKNERGRDKADPESIPGTGAAVRIHFKKTELIALCVVIGQLSYNGSEQLAAATPG